MRILRIILIASTMLLFISSIELSFSGEVMAQPYGEGGINWYPSFDQGMAMARKLNKPVLLVSAAPHCRNISGMW